MTKVMLVEDDNNLREIYEARLTAEGYQTVAAHDGEEALAMAVKEKPDLIISDVMMPKISGFDMLDILRSTPETRNTKVIMMTALSQAEDRQRADKLGADRYLVKSQVTLEDVIKVAHEVLGDGGGEPQPAVPATPMPTSEPVSAPTPVPTPAPAEPAVAAPTPVVPEPVTPAPVQEPTLPTPAPEPIATPTPPNAGISGSTDDVAQLATPPATNPVPPTMPVQPATITTPSSSSQSILVTVPDDATATPTPAQPEPDLPETPENITGPSHQKLVLQPTEGALQPKVDIAALAAQEASQTQENTAAPTANTVITPDNTNPAAPDQIAL